MARVASIMILALLCGCGSSTTSQVTTSVVTLTVSRPTTNTGSAAVTAAAQVRACIGQHALHAAHTRSSPSSSVTTFSYCDWPPPPGADATGYTSITVTTRTGPGQSEASDSDLADYVDSPCRLLQLAYDYGSQGTSQFLPAFRVAAGTVTSMDHPGQNWSGPGVFPYPTRSQVVYIHNGRQIIDTARCASGPAPVAPTATTTAPATGTSTATTTAGATPFSKSFHSPSGNIRCEGFQALTGSPPTMRCDLSSHTYQPPATPSNCPLSWGDSIAVDDPGFPYFLCHGDTVDPGPVLAYGSLWRFGPFTCQAAPSGVTCRNNASHGFVISSQNWAFVS